MERRKTGGGFHGWMTAWALVAAIAVGVSARAATPDLVEAWSGADLSGWIADDYAPVGGALSNPGGYVKISFAKQGTFPTPAFGGLMADDQTAGAAYVGDLHGAGITHVEFRFLTSGQAPAMAQLVFYSAATDREWRQTRGIDFVTEAGVWEANQISVDAGAPSGWESSKGELAADVPGVFLASLQSVDSIGVRVQRNGTPAQYYGVDDFVLRAGDVQATADGLPLWWVTRYFGDGVGGASGGLAAVDSDGDGSSNAAEYHAGTDPTDARSALMMESLAPGAAGIAVSWRSVPGVVYRIWRSADVSLGFNTIVQESFEAVGEWSTYVDPVEGSGPFFYRIEVRIQDL